jgi:hypothetical protein
LFVVFSAKPKATAELRVAVLENRRALTTEVTAKGSTTVHARGTGTAALFHQTQVFIAPVGSILLSKDIAVGFTRFRAWDAGLAACLPDKIWGAHFIRRAGLSFQTAVIAVKN